MHKIKLLTRLVAGAVVAVVTAGSALLVNGVAGATVPPGTQGFLTITGVDSAGNPDNSDIALMRSMTSGPCPATATRANLIMTGPVLADGTAPPTATFSDTDPFVPTQINGSQFSTTGPFTQQFNNTIAGAAAQRMKSIQVGEYHLVTNCLNNLGTTNFGTFTAGLIFDKPTHWTIISQTGTTPTPIPTATPTATPTNTPTATPEPTPTATPTAPPGATATTTRLNVIRLRLPFGLGGFAIPLASVAPSNAAGTVQILDGTTPVGAPVPVSAGFAFGSFFVLPAGHHSLTAVFGPTDPSFTPSTSNTVTFTF